LLRPCYNRAWFTCRSAAPHPTLFMDSRFTYHTLRHVFICDIIEYVFVVRA